MSGVPTSSQSTPARRARRAVDRASGMLVRSREICTIGRMRPSMMVECGGCVKDGRWRRKEVGDEAGDCGVGGGVRRRGADAGGVFGHETLGGGGAVCE